MELKNNLTIARGVGMKGQWGEGFSGTTIKDSWTKPRGGWQQGRRVGLGGVGVEGWGENAVNCN